MNRYFSRRNPLDRRPSGSRKLRIESLESRQLFAADPIILKDINSLPDSAQGSELVAWANSFDLGGSSFFLVKVNGNTELWTTGFSLAQSPTGIGKLATIPTFDNSNSPYVRSIASVRTADSRVCFVHASSTNDNSTLIYRSSVTPGETVVDSLGYATRWLGILRDKIILQRIQDNAILSSDGTAAGTSVVTIESGTASALVQMSDRLYLRVVDATGGQARADLFDFDGSINYSSSYPLSPSRTYFASINNIWSVDPDGSIYEHSFNFSTDRLIAKEPTAPTQLKGTFTNFLYTGQYDAQTNTTRIGSLLSDGRPSSLIATLHGYATIDEINLGNLVVRRAAA